jgi:hypothetical protein
VITDTTPPLDPERRHPLDFIKTELAAKAGVATTGVSTGIAFVESLEPYVKFGAAVVALVVGLATLTYYCLAIVEKWRNLRKDD